ncbi:MAG TPA: efflux RND transporter periplasmic adaptor subunit [Bacteroidales bacterium]|nr:efflux RND transporter periplasmic adaptor subunit [Bacteroidales bacterium]
MKMYLKKLTKKIATPMRMAVLVAATTLLVSSCDQGSSDDATVESEREFPVTVEPVGIQTIDRTIEYSADLKPFEEVHYAPAAPGRINKIYVEIGSYVTKGQKLAEMDQTQLVQARTQLANAKFNFSRIDTLYSLGSISEQQYEQAKTQYELATSNVGYLSENTSLVSPINGIVTAKYYEDGELYSGAPNTPAGKSAIVSLMQIKPLKAFVNVSQSFFPQIRTDQQVVITTDIYPEKEFKGKVYRIHPTIDAATRTFRVEILVENDAQILRPGMFANIEIKLQKVEALMVPAISILKQEGTNNRFIFLAENGTARQIRVEIGKRIDDMIELQANGVQPGAQLIVQGQANLLNGSKIKVVNK